MAFFESLTMNLQQWEWIGILLVRLAVGVMFTISGYSKVFVKEKREQMRETVTEAGIPMPHLNAILVSWIELIFGILLAIGLLTPLACILLSGVMVVAILTVKLQTIESEPLIGWLGEFLFIPDVLYLLMLIWLFFSGPGMLSLDMLLMT